MPSLPPEVVRHIITNIDDTHSLSAASQSGSLFRAPAQEALFADLDFSKVPSEAVKRLSEVLQYSHTLLSYVRGITIKARGFAGDYDETLTQVLLLISVERLRRLSCKGSPYAWVKTSPEFKAAFLALVRGPSLVSLHLGGVPLHSVELRSPDLKDLALTDRMQHFPALESDNDPSDTPTRSSVPITRLESLELEQDEHHIEFIVDPSNQINLTGLKKLVFSYEIPSDPYDTERALFEEEMDDNEERPGPLDLRPLLSQCASSLEVFDFYATDDKYQDYLASLSEVIDFGELTKLRDLTLRNPDNPQFFPGLFNAFPPSHSNALESIRFLGAFFGCATVQQEAGLWKPLDQAFNDNRAKFGKLKSVVISLEAYPESKKEFEEAFLKGLQDLATAGVLKIELRTSDDGYEGGREDVGGDDKDEDEDEY